MTTTEKQSSHSFFSSSSGRRLYAGGNIIILKTRDRSLRHLCPFLSRSRWDVLRYKFTRLTIRDNARIIVILRAFITDDTTLPSFVFHKTPHVVQYNDGIYCLTGKTTTAFGDVFSDLFWMHTLRRLRIQFERPGAVFGCLSYFR